MSLATCPCRDYPYGTQFQALDDERTDVELKVTIEGLIRRVRLTHTSGCVEFRRRTGKRYAMVMAHGLDHADGAWWMWKEASDDKG